MKTLQYFHIPDAPESTVEVPIGISLIYADVIAGEIAIWFLDSYSDDSVTLTFYILAEGDEIADNFPGQYFKRVEIDDRDRFIFFKQNAKKRAPIVAKVAE